MSDEIETKSSEEETKTGQTVTMEAPAETNAEAFETTLGGPMPGEVAPPPTVDTHTAAAQEAAETPAEPLGEPAHPTQGEQSTPLTEEHVENLAPPATLGEAQDLAEKAGNAAVPSPAPKSDRPRDLPAPERERLNAEVLSHLKAADAVLAEMPGERAAKARFKLAETMGAIR